jgi:hypothetical protein
MVVLLAAIMAPDPAGTADTPAVLPIDPVPMIEPFDWVPPVPDRPESRLGMIERMYGDIVVVSDAIRAIASDAVYRSRRDGPATTRGVLSVGKWVGYRLNEAREISEIWIESPPTETR